MNWLYNILWFILHFSQIIIYNFYRFITIKIYRFFKIVLVYYRCMLIDIHWFQYKCNKISIFIICTLIKRYKCCSIWWQILLKWVQIFNKWFIIILKIYFTHCYKTTNNFKHYLKKYLYKFWKTVGLLKLLILIRNFNILIMHSIIFDY